MTTTQVAVLQLDNYGPWTVTPEPRREMNLQTLQAQLYSEIAQFIGTREGYVFPNRFDNMLAVTNGTTTDQLATLQELVADRYPVSVSISVATDPSPGTALADATTALQESGSAQEAERSQVLRGESLSPDARTHEDVQVAHFDIVDATEKYTDRISAFDTTITVDRVHSTLRDFLYEQYDALTFFVGGDNFISICPGLTESEFASAIDHVRRSVSVELRVGSGVGKTACEAGLLAKDALEACRHRGTAIEEASVSAETTIESATHQ